MTMIDLHEFKHNSHSQWGEDGILDRLFGEMGVEKGVFCEFGAWDGMHLSNTYAFYKKGWSGIYIEGSPVKFVDLKQNIDATNVDLVCAFVRPEGEDALDRLLEKSAVIQKACKLDLLSIDIDSDDLAIFTSLKQYRPSVVVIEYNNTIPFDIEYINPPGENKGNSPLSIYKAARERNYKLVAVTRSNLILVAAETLPATVKTFSLEDIDSFPAVRFFFGYDGALISCSRDVNGAVETAERELIRVPWQLAYFPQPVPRLLRSFGKSKFMDRVLLAYSAFVILMARPVAGFRYTRKRLKDEQAQDRVPEH